MTRRGFFSLLGTVLLLPLVPFKALGRRWARPYPPGQILYTGGYGKDAGVWRQDGNWKLVITDGPTYGCGWLGDDGIMHHEVRDSKTDAVLVRCETRFR